MKALHRLVAAPFVILIRLYRTLISPWKPRTCRFEPSCSAYALEALQMHPLPRALWLILRRLGRCHPWGGSGRDPVPRPRR